MVQERKNRLMAYRVEQGLKVQQVAGTRAAADFLANYGVPLHVSMRVLSTTNRREMSDVNREPFWLEIIMAAGATYGAKMEFF
jgi:hypothetical protein